MMPARQDQYLVSWYNLQLDGSRDEKLLTFHCHTGGWYLQIPTLWQEHLVLTRSAVAGSTLGYRFLWEAGGSTEELLTIAALSASDLSALGDGWQVLTQKGETVYVCRLHAAPWRSASRPMPSARNSILFRTTGRPATLQRPDRSPLQSPPLGGRQEKERSMKRY